MKFYPLRELILFGFYNGKLTASEANGFIQTLNQIEKLPTTNTYGIGGMRYGK